MRVKLIGDYGLYFKRNGLKMLYLSINRQKTLKIGKINLPLLKRYKKDINIDIKSLFLIL